MSYGGMSKGKGGGGVCFDRERRRKTRSLQHFCVSILIIQIDATVGKINQQAPLKTAF